MRVLALAAFTLVLALGANAQSGYSSGSASGSGSGSGSGDMVDCASDPCGYNAMCMDVDDTYVCYCEDGYRLNDYNGCDKCPAGTWGMNCMNQCSCGTGNSCRNTDGTCICNSCFEGPSCQTPIDARCVRDFLEVSDKCEDALKEMYGGVVFPMPPSDTLTGFVTNDLMEINAAVVQMEPEYLNISRSDVDQGQLIKLTWTVNKNFDRPSAEEGLNTLTEQVKLGNLRCTLIINSLEDRAEVTLNAGVRKNCND